MNDRNHEQYRAYKDGHQEGVFVDGVEHIIEGSLFVQLFDGFGQADQDRQSHKSQKSEQELGVVEKVTVEGHDLDMANSDKEDEVANPNEFDMDHQVTLKIRFLKINLYGLD